MIVRSSRSVQDYMTGLGFQTTAALLDCFFSADHSVHAIYIIQQYALRLFAQYLIACSPKIHRQTPRFGGS